MKNIVLIYLALLLSNFILASNEVNDIDIEIDVERNIDPHGYLVYCPCMGRFGNQADHFLGSLGFAKAIDRTLILPPWIEYRQGALRSLQIPFDTYFQVEPITKYHRVITMDKFMKVLAPKVWPTNKRFSLCYTERKSLSGSSKMDCHAKEGNPFGPFWDEFNIDFVDSEFYGPLNYDTLHAPNMVEKWHRKYPADAWPVLAFTGAPATFPVQKENTYLQKHLIWSENLHQKAIHWIKTSLPKGAFIGIHLRNGVDWMRACEHVDSSPSLFSAAQCVGYRNEKGKVDNDMCMPSKEIILKQLKYQIRAHNEFHPDNLIKSVFVASDNYHMIEDINHSLRRLDIEAFKLNETSPHLDLIILEKSNRFIGNCISSFSAFVKRARDVRSFPSVFWAFPKDSYLGKKRNKKVIGKDEL